MNLYYVEHEVLVRKTYALIAADDEDLKRLLAEREATIRVATFSPKLQRDKKGAVLAHKLNADWTRAPHGPKWDGTAKGE